MGKTVGWGMRGILASLLALQAGAGAETLAEIGARLGRDTTAAYAASPFSILSRDYFARFTRDPNALPAANETAVEPGWGLSLPAEPAPVTKRMAEYLADFLARRMEAPVEMRERNGAESARAIVLYESGGGTDVAESFTLRVTEQRIEILGRDPNGLRDGVVRLVDLMGDREAPYLARGEQVFVPRLPVRLGAVPSNGSFRELVFLGYNAVFAGGGSIYALSTSDAIPELGVRRAAGMLERQRAGNEEARQHGLKTYAFIDARQKFPEDDPIFAAHPELRGTRTWTADGEFTLCTEHPLMQRWLRESARGIFESDPGIAGLVLIIGGEGFYHCFMRPYGVEKGHTNCSRCEALGAETVVANLCNLLAGAAREVRGDAEVVVWPYSAEHVWSKDKTQEALIERLQPGVSLLSEIEKDEYVAKPGGVNKHLWDYSIDLIGPGVRAEKQIAACARAGIRIYLKSEPEIGFEAVRLPHIPCMDRWWDRAEALASCGAAGAWVFPAFRPNYGTSATEINKRVWWSPAPDKEAALDAFARRLFGAAAAPKMRAAWRHVSDAMPLSPVLPPYYTGPQYLGPAHPMILDPEAPVPEVFLGYYLFMAEMNDAEGVKKRPAYFTKPHGDAKVFGEYYRRMEAELHAAAELAGAAAPLVPEAKRLLFEAEASPIRWLYHTARTTANFYEACPLRDQLIAAAKGAASDAAELTRARDGLREILLDEMANTKAAFPVIEADMRLDCYYGGDHTLSHAADMMHVKIELLKEEIERTLPRMAENAGVPFVAAKLPQ